MEWILAIVVAGLVLATISNGKRINQLERDLSEQGGKYFAIPDAAQAPMFTEKETLEDTLKAAGVLEPKAYRAAAYAVRYKWSLLDIQQNIKMVRYMRADGGDVVKVNVYHGGRHGLYTVATALKHPTHGATQLFRKNIGDVELEAILKNPRQHTGKGYYERAGKR